MSSTINASVDGIVLTASSTAAMNLATGGTNRLSIDTSGNVGIATGNLTFSSTGQRITGDFSNATLTSRLAFQTSTTDGATRLMVLPNGTSTTSAFNLLNTSDANNASYLTFACESTVVAFRATNAGTGTLLPMAWVTGGSERMRLDTSGNLGIGTASPVTRLHVLDALSGGQFIVANSETNSAEKYGTFATQHYTNAEEPALGVAVQSSATENNILIGGALGEFNAATAIKFYTAANNTTTSGTQRMTIDSSGNVGIGGTASAFAKVEITGNFPGTTAGIGHYVNTTAPNGMTANVQGFRTNIGTAAAAFTLVDMHHFYAVQGAFGATSAVTNQYGFHAASSLTGATNNYGFYSNIASGSNRWNFYANGTAQNYFAGETGVGRVPVSGVRLTVRGSNTAATDYALACYDSSDFVLLYTRNDGYINTGTRTNSPYNATTGSAANMFVDSNGGLLRSTSSLRYKSEVTDATHGLADVLKLRSVTYKGKNDGDKVFGGLIAEEVHDAGLTEFVAYDKEGRPDALHYGNMVALAFKAIQELKAENDALKARIEALETK